jgi:DNA-binding response OmpR family regulator
MMIGQARFLLINGAHDQYWPAVLEAALAPLGILQIGLEQDAARLVQLGIYDLLIVDATIENVSLLIGRLRAQRPAPRIMVVTASPTWRRAREAFQAGAIDYVRKSIDTEELRSAVRSALEKTLPP